MKRILPGAVLESLPLAIALTLLAALPAFINLASELVFEEPKALVFRAAALVALPGTFLVLRRERFAALRHPIVLALAALVAALTVATLLTGSAHDAVLGGHLRRHGLVAWLALAVVFAALLTGATTADGRERILSALVIGSLWPSLYLLMQRAGFDPILSIAPTQGAMTGSTFGNGMVIGGYLALVVPVTATKAWRDPYRWSLPLVLQLAALVVAASRGAMVAVGAAGLTALAVALWGAAQRRVSLAAIAAIGIAAAALVVLPAARPAALAARFDPSIGGARVRVLIWQGTIGILRESGARLLIGHGPESLRGLFPPHYSAEIGRLEQSGAMPDRAHNETLDMLVSGGAVAVACEWLLFGVAAAGALRLKDPVSRAGLAAAIVGHVVEIQFGIASIVSRLAFASVAAVIAGAALEREPSPAPERQATPLVWVGGAAAIGALSLWLSVAPARFVTSQTSVDEAQLVAYLYSIVAFTPVFYAGLLGLAGGLAAVLARSGGRPARPVIPTWIHASLLLTAMAGTIPLSIDAARADGFSAAAASFAGRRLWAEAAVAYREASSLQPADARYLADLGEASIRRAMDGLDAPARDRFLQDASDAFESARTIDPHDLDHTRHLAASYRVRATTLSGPPRDQALAEADRLYGAATAWAPNVTHLWVEWAYVDLDRRQPFAALDKLSRALTLDPMREDARSLRARILQSMPR